MKTMADTHSVIELPATVTDIKAWIDNLPANAQVEATVYNSFKKATGRTKIQRLVAHC